MNPGSRADHDKFCRTEGWETIHNARRRKGGPHITYELALPDGRRLRTRISRPANNTVYGPALWKMILREHLDVTEDDFWACVKDKRLPDRGWSQSQPSTGALPAGLIYQLVHTAHIPESDAIRLSLDEAIALMADHWRQSAGG